MKRNILIFSAAVMTLGLFGFGIQNWNRKGANQNLTAGAQRAEISKIDETWTKFETSCS